MSFLAPLMLLGLTLASAPIIIHLLNRRRFLRVDWAPMKYLKLTLKTNRRRLQLEQWLLLALRTLAVMLLFWALARPVVSGVQLGTFLQARGRTSRVVVIDDSLSMGYRTAGPSALDRAKRATAEVVRLVGAQDSLTVLLTSRPEAPLVRQAQIEDPADLLESIDAVRTTHLAGQWMSILDTVDKHLQAAVFPLREVTLVTDLRRQGWGDDVTELLDRWAADNIALRIIDVGAEPVGNLVLQSLEQNDPVALIDTKVRFTARVRNDGAEPVASLEATLKVDDQSRTVVLPNLPPGRRVEVPISVTFDEPGQHVVELALPADNLPEDNRRYLMVDVGRSMRPLLVDGEPSGMPFESETDFLALAFSVGTAPWRVRRLTDAEWLDSPLAAPDVLVLANVASIPAQRAGEIEAMVEAGMGLMIFLGDQVDPAGYNETLFRNGAGLLPCRIGPSRDQRITGMVVEPLTDSPLGALTRISPESLAQIRLRRFAHVALPDETTDQVRVLARWNDASRSPAVLEKRWGQGRVLVWTITADKAWSDWPTEASYVLAVRQAALTVAGSAAVGDNVLAGEPLGYALDAANLPAKALILEPKQKTPRALPIDLTDPQAPRLRYAGTQIAGVYQMSWRDPALGDRSRRFAVSPDTRESDLRPLETQRLEQLLGKLDWSVVRFTDDAVELSGAGAELWRVAVWMLLLLLVVESPLAAWVGRER